MTKQRRATPSEQEAAARLASGEAWAAFCDALKDAGRVILDHAPDHELDRAEGFRYLTRLTRMGLKLCLEHADPAAPRRSSATAPATSPFPTPRPRRW